MNSRRLLLRSGIKSVNVDTGVYLPGRHPQGAPTNRLILHRSDDGRQLAFVSEMPDGARFVETRRDIKEGFYILRGRVRVELKPGEVMQWREGDLVYWP